MSILLRAARRAPKQVIALIGLHTVNNTHTWTAADPRDTGERCCRPVSANKVESFQQNCLAAAEDLERSKYNRDRTGCVFCMFDC